LVNRLMLGVVWIGLYLGVVLIPVFMMMFAPHPSGRPFLLEFSVALGFVGLTQIAIQFALIARFQRVTAPYGIDAILRYHRQIALLAIVFILIHPILVIIHFPPRAALLNPLGGNWASRFGWMSIAALLLIATTSLWRTRIRLNYERWRLLHLSLAIAAVVTAQVHVSLAGLYINTAWKHAMWIGIALLMVSFEVYLRLVKPLQQRRRPWRIVDVKRERGDSYSVVAEADGHEGMKFHPGQFAWLKLKTPFSLDEHPFSFSSSATERARVEFGVKAVGDFTRALGDLPKGTEAYLDGPHGAFSIDRSPAAGYVFMAGGIGVTPFLSCLRTMAARGDRRPVTMFYAVKDWEDATYREALTELEQAMDLELIVVVEEPPEGWEGESGMIDDALLERRLPKDELDREILICGPPPMIEAVEDALRRLKVPEARVHSERFDLV
jgi:predicted ferric reductase